MDELLCCDLSSARMDILARYAKFVRGLLLSPSMEVAVMANVARRDIRTVTGSNCALILRETGMSPVSCCIGKLKQVLKLRITTAPDTDRWRLEYLGKLLTQRGEASYMAETAEVLRLSSLIDSLSTN